MMVRPYPQRKSPRLQGYDYSQAGLYFVTICAHERACLFGEVLEGMMQLNDLGQIAQDQWLSLGERFTNVEVDCFIVMPNHVHAIVQLLDPSEQSKPLGVMVASYKVAVVRIGRRNLAFEAPIWQGRYHDHIIRNEANLQKIREYMQLNPMKWESDRFYST